MPASERLSHLLELADKGPALRAALAEEVAELLTAWPADYPDAMRNICESLLARTALDVDADTRARLRVQLCADPALSARVLPREPASRNLVDAARAGEAMQALAWALTISEPAACTILDDDSGELLAIACKGAGLDRATFSALAIITRRTSREKPASYALLDMFDLVPHDEATRRLAEWRQPETAHAA
jgi:hypothetical protein